MAKTTDEEQERNTAHPRATARAWTGELPESNERTGHVSIATLGRKRGARAHRTGGRKKATRRT